MSIYVREALERAHKNALKELADTENSIASLRHDLHDAVMQRQAVTRRAHELAMELSKYPEPAPTKAEPKQTPQRWATGIEITPAQIRAAGGRLPEWRGSLTRTPPEPIANAMPGTVKVPLDYDIGEARHEAAESMFGNLPHEEVVENAKALAGIDGKEGERLSAAFEKMPVIVHGQRIDPLTGYPADPARASLLKAYDEAKATIEAMDDADPAKTNLLHTLEVTLANCNSVEAVFQAIHGDKRAGRCTVPPEGWACTRDPGHEGPCAAWPVGGDSTLAGQQMQDFKRRRLDATAAQAPSDPGDAAELLANPNLRVTPSMAIELFEPPQRRSRVASTIRKWLGRPA